MLIFIKIPEKSNKKNISCILYNQEFCYKLGDKKMKIFQISSSLHPKRVVNPSFSQLVDYGAKDKDMIYVPILFEEEDTFTSSTSQPGLQEPNVASGAQKVPKKLGGKFLKNAGTFVAGVEVFPDVAQSAMNKVSGLLDSTKDFANKSIDSISEIKTHYREKFPKENPNDNIKSENVHKEEMDEFVANSNGSHGEHIPDSHESDEFSQLGGSASEHPANPEYLEHHTHPEISETQEFGYQGGEGVDYSNFDGICGDC